MYINENVNGVVFASKKPMTPKHYVTVAIMKCVRTKSRNVNRNNISSGVIGIDIHGESFKVVSVKMRKGYKRDYIIETNK